MAWQHSNLHEHYECRKAPDTSDINALVTTWTHKHGGFGPPSVPL